MGSKSKKVPAAAQCSRLVTHVNTLWPLRCLSARIGRDAEGSSRYGRRWQVSPHMSLCMSLCIPILSANYFFLPVVPTSNISSTPCTRTSSRVVFEGLSHDMSLNFWKSAGEGEILSQSEAPQKWPGCRDLFDWRVCRYPSDPSQEWNPTRKKYLLKLEWTRYEPSWRKGLEKVFQ